MIVLFPPSPRNGERSPSAARGVRGAFLSWSSAFSRQPTTVAFAPRIIRGFARMIVLFLS